MEHAKGPMRAIEDALARGERIFLDGATGTELQRRGAPMHEKAWCATATETHPEILRAVHESYIRAGARVITTNTFATSRDTLEPAGLGHRFESLNRRAAAIAHEARERAGGRGRVAVAGSLTHELPIEPGTGQPDAGTREAFGLAPAAARFREMADLLADCGVDLLLLEMMSDPDLANPALEAALGTGLPVWVGFSVRMGDDGTLRSYGRPDLPAERMLDEVPLDGVRAAGIMHSHVNLVAPGLEQVRARFEGPLLAYPDSGYFRMPNWQFVDLIPPEEFARACRGWADDGVRILGACCGLGVEHIEALSAAVDVRPAPPGPMRAPIAGEKMPDADRPASGIG